MISLWFVQLSDLKFQKYLETFSGHEKCSCSLLGFKILREDFLLFLLYHTSFPFLYLNFEGKN